MTNEEIKKEFEEWSSNETVKRRIFSFKSAYFAGRLKGQEEIDKIKETIRFYLDDPKFDVLPLMIIINPKLEEVNDER